jgi:transcriptional regulator with XRE-family HTH domain
MTTSWERPSDTVARRVQELRQRRGWSVARLAEECARTGAPELTESVLTNMLTRRRRGASRPRDVTIDEVVALARALDVPPVGLWWASGDPAEHELLLRFDSAQDLEEFRRVVEPMMERLYGGQVAPRDGDG